MRNNTVKLYSEPEAMHYIYFLTMWTIQKPSGLYNYSTKTQQKHLHKCDGEKNEQRVYIRFKLRVSNSKVYTKIQILE